MKTRISAARILARTTIVALLAVSAAFFAGCGKKDDGGDSTDRKEAADKGEKELKKAQDAIKAKNYKDAVKSLQAAADKGNSDAMFTLGCIYFDEESGVGKDEEKAVSLINKAAEAGNVKARFLLAAQQAKDDNISGEEAMKKIKSLESELLKLAEAGDAEAQALLVLAAFDSDRDDASATLDYLEKAAAAGDIDAEVALFALNTRKLNRTDKDEFQKKLGDLKEKLKALALKGDDHAMQLYDKLVSMENSLNEYFEQLDEDYGMDDADMSSEWNDDKLRELQEKASSYLKKSAHYGNAEAMSVLSEYYLSKGNEEQAVKWAKKAERKKEDRAEKAAKAEDGNKDAVDKGEPKDAEAERKAIPAAEKGEKELKAAQDAIKTQKFEDAVKNLQTAADKGNSDAMFLLAYCYGVGKGVNESDEKAEAFMQKSADAGNVKAKALLAFKQIDDEKISKEDAMKQIKALEPELLKLAEAGDADAQAAYALVALAMDDFSGAMEWAEKAKKNGSILALSDEEEEDFDDEDFDDEDEDDEDEDW